MWWNYQMIGGRTVNRLEVGDFPVMVINAIRGGDLCEEGKARYQVKAA